MVWASRDNAHLATCVMCTALDTFMRRVAALEAEISAQRARHNRAVIADMLREIIVDDHDGRIDLGDKGRERAWAALTYLGRQGL